MAIDEDVDVKLVAISAPAYAISWDRASNDYRSQDHETYLVRGIRMASGGKINDEAFPSARRPPM